MIKVVLSFVSTELGEEAGGGPNQVLKRDSYPAHFIDFLKLLKDWPPLQPVAEQDKRAVYALLPLSHRHLVRLCGFDFLKQEITQLYQLIDVLKPFP